MPHKAPGQSSEILVRAYQRIRTSCPSIADRWIVDADIVDVMVAAYPSLDDPDTPLLNSAKFNKAVTTYGNTTFGPNFPMPNNPTGHYRVVHSLTPTTNGKRVTQRKTFYYYESSPRVNGFPEIPKIPTRLLGKSLLINRQQRLVHFWPIHRMSLPFTRTTKLSRL
jgi:hypothetical protein